MNLQRLTVAAVVLALVGCVTAEQSSLVTPLSSSDLTLPAPPSVARLQQPDGEHVSESATAASALLPPSKIRAVVNGSPILDEEVRQAVIGALKSIANMPDAIRAAKADEIFNAGLDQLIERELIYTHMMDMLKTRPQILDKLKEYSEQEFTRETRKMREGAHIPSEEEFRTALEQQGLTYENLKRSITRGFMTNEYMRNRIFNALDPLGLPQIRQYYEEHPGEFMLQDRVRWQDIFIDAFSFKSRAEAHAHAEAIARRAMAGEDFAALVQEFDQGTSKGMPNGEGIGQERGQIRPPELEPYLFQLKSGEVGPILEMPFGYHVFRVVHREYAGRQPFDAKTQEEITKKIKDLIAKREYKRIVDDLRRKATIQKFLDN